MRHLISVSDRQLLDRQFRKRGPQRLTGLTMRVARGVKAARIVYWYDERHTVPGNSKPIMCAFGHYHGRGFVVDLVDGRTVLVGKDCALKDFGIDFGEMIKSFVQEEDRQYQIRRLLAIRETLPAAIRELEELLSDPAVTAFDDYWQALGRHFGKLAQQLAKVLRSSQGRLVATQMVYSESATEREAIAAAKKRAKQADEPSLHDRVTLAKTPEDRRIAVERWVAFVATRRKVFVPKPIDLGPCHGWTLTRVADRSTPWGRITEALAIARNLDLERSTDRWGIRDFAKLRRNVDAIFEAVDDAVRLVADLSEFASAENIDRIAAWARAVEAHDDSIGLSVKAEGAALVGRARLALPKGYAWPATPDLRALRSAREQVDALDEAA